MAAKLNPGDLAIVRVFEGSIGSCYPLADHNLRGLARDVEQVAGECRVIGIVVAMAGDALGDVWALCGDRVVKGWLGYEWPET